MSYMDVDFELEMKISRRDYRVLLLHEFHLGRKVTKATSDIYSTMHCKKCFVQDKKFANVSKVKKK